MVGNDIVVIRQMSLLVVVHENYGVSDSSQQGKTWKLWCFWLRLCTLIIFARVQQSDPWCYLNINKKQSLNFFFEIVFLIFFLIFF